MISALYLRKNLAALLLVCIIVAVLVGYFLTRAMYKTLPGYGRSALVESGSCVLSMQDELYMTGCNSTL